MCQEQQAKTGLAGLGLMRYGSQGLEISYSAVNGWL